MTATTEYGISNDALWDRTNPEYRYRLYSFDTDGDLHVLAACEDAGAVGVALVTLTDEGARVCGVLDVQPGGVFTEKSTWIVSPFQRSWAHA